MKKQFSPGTTCVHGSYDPKCHNRSRAVPLYQSAAFVYDSVDHAANLFSLDEPGFIYSRLGNPTVDEAEKRIALLEKGHTAVAFSSGMAALTGFCINMLKPGDEIVAASCLYGGSMGLLKETLPTLGIITRFFDPLSEESLRQNITEKTRLVFIENLANPSLVIPDVAQIHSIAQEYSLPLLVDNTIATPFLTNPIDYGADFILHSCTKYMEGHGGIIGGVIVDGGTFNFTKDRYPLLFDPAPDGKPFVEKYGKDAFCTRLRGKVLMNTGGCMSPFHAYLLIRGLESLHVRMERHCTNAEALVTFLSQQEKVAWVNYPGIKGHHSNENAKKYFKNYFGGMVGFGLTGGYEQCKAFINAVHLLTHSTNIGDTKTLVIHPASTTHRNLTEKERLDAGISEDFIRISVGIEDSDDLINEIRKILLKI